MKIGLFFGSFNPIHTGHLVIASYMAQFTELDKVWLVVSPHNPFKEKSSLLADHHRLALVKKAIEFDKRLKACDIEFKLEQPSYTINTLLHLEEKYPTHQFCLIMGSDNLMGFHKWKNYEQIVANYEIYVYPRPGFDAKEALKHPNIKLTSAPIMEISSTFVREAIANKKNVRYFLPDSVYDYISEMNFYKRKKQS